MITFKTETRVTVTLEGIVAAESPMVAREIATTLARGIVQDFEAPDGFKILATDFDVSVVGQPRRK